MVEASTDETKQQDSKSLGHLLLVIFDFDQSVGLYIKLSLTARNIFLVFKHHAKDGKVKHLNHVDHGSAVSEHFVRRLCARRIGKQLQSLNFQFSAVTDDHVSLCKFPETLESLNLNACREISERTLVQVSEQCPNLRIIELYWNCRMSDFGVKRLAAGCPKLTVVNLSGCKLLTDRSIIVLVQTCRELKILNLTRVTAITDESMKAVITNLEHLRELYLYANSQLSDQAFQYFADADLSKCLAFSF